MAVQLIRVERGPTARGHAAARDLACCVGTLRQARNGSGAIALTLRFNSHAIHSDYRHAIVWSRDRAAEP
jgi:hypothetical protein